MNLRDRIIDMLNSHGVFNAELADDIEALCVLERGGVKDDARPCFLAGVRRSLDHQAGLLRVATPETAAAPAFRERMAGVIAEIGGRIA